MLSCIKKLCYIFAIPIGFVSGMIVRFLQKKNIDVAIMLKKIEDNLSCFATPCIEGNELHKMKLP